MKKTFKKVLASLSAIALLSSSFVVMQASADDIPYIDIYNSQGVGGSGDSTINYIGTRTIYNDDPVMGNYSTLTGSFVHVCEYSNDIATTWADNIEAGRLTVVEADFMPDENTQYVHLYTYYTKKMTYSVDLTKLGDIVKIGQWNHVKIVADTSVFAKSNNGTTMDRIPSAVWVNGVQVLSMNISKYGSAGYTLASIRERLAGGSTQYIRLRFDAKSGETTTVGIDNTVIKTVDSTEVYTNDYNSGYDLVPETVQNITPSYVSGAAGRASDDTSYLLTPTTANGYIELRVPTGRKYFKQEFDVLPSNGFGTFYAKARNQNLTYGMFALTTSSTTANQWLKPNQWNHLVFISEVTSLDLTTGDATIITAGYANGTLVTKTTRTGSSTQDFTDGSGYGRTYYPLRWGYVTVGQTLTIDNFKINISDTQPEVTQASKIASSSLVNVVAPSRYDNGTIVACTGADVTPADLTLEGGSIRVYTDDTYATQLADTDVIEDGDFVVATDANGIVTYYDYEGFQQKAETILDVNFNSQTASGTVGSLSKSKGTFGYEIAGGKSDYSMSIANSTDVDGFASFTAAPTTATSIVIEYNVMPTDDNLSYVSVGTGWSNPIFPKVSADSLVKNQWNHIVALVNPVNPGSIANSTNYPVSASVSINGGEFSTPEYCYPRTTADGKSDLRFVAAATSKTVITKVLLDDIKVTTANYALTPEISMPYATSSVGTVTDSTISGATLSDITACPDGATVKAYTDATFSTEVTDTLADGNIIVVSKDNLYKYYTYEAGPTYKVADYGVLNKNDERSGFYYNLLVSEVNDSLSLGLGDTDFTITELGSFDVTASITYVITGARALGDIPSISSVKSGETVYSAK